MMASDPTTYIASKPAPTGIAQSKELPQAAIF